MKKVISVFLCLLMLMSVLALGASAASLSQGTEAIRATFEEGKTVLDYVYFSPVKGENDDTKYPLVLWLHGNSSGDYPGHQLVNTDIHKFASDEYQARFKDAGGAFLLLPRDATTDASLAWDGKIDDAKETLDLFIEEYQDNIDISRIYVGGNSMGGKGVYKIAAGYPGVFAAIFPISPVYIPTTSEANALADTAVWIFSNDNDRYPQLSVSSVKSVFNKIVNASYAPENCRRSSFSEYYRPDGSTDSKEVHNTWTPVLNDLFMNNGEEYYAMTTVDGTGRTINLTYPEGFISWLSSQSLEEGTVASSNINFFTRIIEFFTNIINALISIFGL